MLNAAMLHFLDHDDSLNVQGPYVLRSNNRTLKDAVAGTYAQDSSKHCGLHCNLPAEFPAYPFPPCTLSTDIMGLATCASHFALRAITLCCMLHPHYFCTTSVDS